MKFKQKQATLLIPDEQPLQEALSRTTHLAIGAHQDDLEIMAYHGISTCFQHPEKWFTGVVVTNGKGSPRRGAYERYTDDDMIKVRAKEQEKAARIGEYSAQFLLAYPSSNTKDSEKEDVINELHHILEQTQPNVVYLHNLADKHDTHIAVALCALKALRRLKPEQHPQEVYGVEIWQALDWLPNEDKQILNVGDMPNLSQALLGVFDSQMAGWKRFDLATAGRRLANATFLETHGTETVEAAAYAMDLKPLIANPDLSPIEYTLTMLKSFSDSVKNRLEKFI